MLDGALDVLNLITVIAVCWLSAFSAVSLFVAIIVVFEFFHLKFFKRNK
jgi:hypothetical protein